MDLLAVERATLAAWRARETAELDGWVQQADGGATGRPNAAVALEHRGDIDATIAAFAAWYAARGLVPQIKIVEGACAPADLATRLAQRSYQSHTPTLTMTSALMRDARTQTDVVLTPEATSAFQTVFGEARVSDADHAERWGLITRAPQPKAHAVIEIDGRPAAIGLSVVTGEHAGLFAMRTPAWARRRGLARRIVDALLVWAATQGAQTMYLQVEENNAAAIALYEQAGFAVIGRYAYWRATRPA